MVIVGAVIGKLEFLLCRCWLVGVLGKSVRKVVLRI